MVRFYGRCTRGAGLLYTGIATGLGMRCAGCSFGEFLGNFSEILVVSRVRIGSAGKGVGRAGKGVGSAVYLAWRWM